MNKNTLNPPQSQADSLAPDFFSWLPTEFFHDVNSLLREHKGLTRRRIIQEGTQLLFFRPTLCAALDVIAWIVVPRSAIPVRYV